MSFLRLEDDDLDLLEVLQEDSPRSFVPPGTNYLSDDGLLDDEAFSNSTAIPVEVHASHQKQAGKKHPIKV